MDKTRFDEIVSVLLPEMDDPAARKALIEGALFGSPILQHIQWDGAARPFTVRLVRQLADYGELAPGQPALVALLAELRAQVGINRQSEINRIIQQLTRDTQKGKTTMALEGAVLMGFLLEVGRWAKSELSEIWKLRREQQTADLTNKAETEATLPTQIESITAEKNVREVERITTLIERKRDAIDRARNAKLADREQLDRQELLQSSFEQLEKKHNKTIKQMLDEIEADLNDLGFEVEREPA